MKSNVIVTVIGYNNMFIPFVALQMLARPLRFSSEELAQRVFLFKLVNLSTNPSYIIITCPKLKLVG